MTNNEHQFEQSLQLLKQVLKKSRDRVKEAETRSAFRVDALTLGMSRLDVSMAKLAAAQALADKKLRMLIDRRRQDVEGHDKERHSH